MNIRKVDNTIIKQDLKPDKLSNKSSLEESLPNENLDNDILSISEQARALLEEERYKEHLLEELKKMELDTQSPLDPLVKCIKISMRIIAGDNVPEQDEAYLLEHFPEMYSSAMTFRRQKEDAKNYDSLIEDDKNDNEAVIAEDRVTEKITSKDTISESDKPLILEM